MDIATDLARPKTHLKVKCVIFGNLEEESPTSGGCILNGSALSLSLPLLNLPENCGGLCTFFFVGSGCQHVYILEPFFTGIIYCINEQYVKGPV